MCHALKRGSCLLSEVVLGNQVSVANVCHRSFESLGRTEQATLSEKLQKMCTSDSCIGVDIFKVAGFGHEKVQNFD